MQPLVSTVLATAALATASLPALSWTVWPDVDFEWYANVGKPLVTTVVVAYPAPREGMIWSPAHYEVRGTRTRYVAGHWIRDDYAERLSDYTGGSVTYLASAAPRDRYGYLIATRPESSTVR
jgi:hypothetical protein